jgi:hypothetical protein
MNSVLIEVNPSGVRRVSVRVHGNGEQKLSAVFVAKIADVIDELDRIARRRTPPEPC